MLRLPLHRIEPGMKLAMGVHHPYRPSSQLLAAGCVLQANVIRRLAALRIGEVWIDCPQLHRLHRYLTPELVRARDQLAIATCRLFEQVLAPQPPSLVELFAILRELRTIFENDKQAAVFLPCLSRGSDLLLQHATDTAVLAIQLAMRLEGHISQQRRDVGFSSEGFVEQIALGALLHDVGLYMLPGPPPQPTIRWHDERSTAERQHVFLGHRALRGHLDANAAAIVMHHHQHCDGSGYPERDTEGAGSTGLEAARIPIYVRVVTLADVFDETRLGQCDPPRPPGEALSETLSPTRLPWFDPVVAEALPQAVVPFPPGSRARLSSGEEGVIVDFSHEEPSRPTVQIVVPGALADPRLPCPLYDLRQRRDLAVVALDGVELTRAPLARAS